MGGGSVYGGDEEEVDVRQVQRTFSSCANLVQCGIVDIDEIQNHGKPHSVLLPLVAANLGRRQCFRHHQAEAEWHPHCRRKLLPASATVHAYNG